VSLGPAEKLDLLPPTLNAPRRPRVSGPEPAPTAPPAGPAAVGTHPREDPA
jgi:hypothetical protein